MEIYLVRHTRPLIGKDTCYGQTDMPVDETAFAHAAAAVLDLLPAKVDAIYSSPLIRCSFLAAFIQQEKYPALDIVYNHLLKEVNFGEWENKKWDDIDQMELTKWMHDFVNDPVPGGESFIQLHQRTQQFVKNISNLSHTFIIIVTHAGVIRSITSHLQQTELRDSFTINCDYGSITKLKMK